MHLFVPLLLVALAGAGVPDRVGGPEQPARAIGPEQYAASVGHEAAAIPVAHGQGAVPVGPDEAPQIPGEPSGRLRVVLLTMDQGDEVWERFGHNAILIHDEATNEGLTWNWGLFDFADVDFLPRFLRGTMRYGMGPAPLDPFIQSYVRAGRSVYANEVRLTDEQAHELDRFVRWNYLPENREYTYDYFRDNCSTRVRDALDRVLGGAIREAFADRETPRTWRWHSRRLVQETLWIDQGLSFLLGTRGDRRITEWDEMFVPMELMDLLEGMDVANGEGGASQPLLGPREVVYEAPRGPAPASAPTFHPGWLAAGLLLGGLAAGLGRVASEAPRPEAHQPPRGAPEGRSGAARVALGVLGALWALFAGALGLLLVLAWFTDHVFIHWNMNVLYANPLLLVLGPLLLAATVRTEWWSGRVGAVVRTVALAVAALSFLAALVQLTGIVRQGNPEVVAFALPLNVGLAAAVVLAGAGVRGGARATPAERATDRQEAGAR